MHKKNIFLFLTLISSGMFYECSASEKLTVYQHGEIVSKQLKILEEQSQSVSQNQSHIYSFGNLLTNTIIMIGLSGIVGPVMDVSGQLGGNNDSQKSLVFCCTIATIAATLMAKDMYISRNLRQQQTNLIASMDNIRKELSKE